MSTLSPSVDNFVPVGSPQILTSPHVSEGPGRVATAPIPSIFMDDRGSIHRLRIGHLRVNLLWTVADAMRSGYLHNVKTHDFVISGKVQVWTLTEKGTVKQDYGPTQYFTVDPYVPHIMFFLEDTNLVEWYDGTSSDFKLWYYHPYRNVVNIQNSAAPFASKHSPRHHRLVLKDEDTTTTTTTNTATSWNGYGTGVSRTTFAFWTMTALAAGWVLGVMAATADTTSSPSSKKS